MENISIPFYNNRKSDIDMVVIHCTPTNLTETLEFLQRRELSSHYIIDFDGKVVKCVEEQYRTWHAGIGKWREISEDINSHSIGIELCKLDGGQSFYPDAQIDKLIHIVQKIVKKYNIKPQMIVGHSDIAPTRKYDPGLGFPWKRLAKEGLGLWYQIRNADKMPENDVAKLLSIIGYDTSDISAAQYAFCRHFLPEFISVVDDVSELVDNPYPKDFDVSGDEKFIKTLKAVAYSYSKA